VIFNASNFVRYFARDPDFIAAAVVTLALGIAPNTAIFSVVHAALLRPLTYKQPDQVAILWANIPAKGIAADWTLWPTIQEWRKQSKSLEDVAANMRPRRFKLGCLEYFLLARFV
jgi:putative ABC transport system permease protein